MRAFRVERTAKIVGGETPTGLLGSCCLVLHVVPFSAFDFGAAISLRMLENQPNLFPPLNSEHSQGWRITFDGFLTLSNADQAAGKNRAYVQVFRSGAVEAVTSTLGGSKGELVCLDLEVAIVPYTRRYIAALQSSGIDPPYAVLVSLLGTAGRKLSMGQADWLHTEPLIDLRRDQFHLGEVILETVPSDNQGCASAMRPVLDQLANIAGYAATTSFDSAGRWRSSIHG
jgi:hypothetical protein